MYVSFIVVVGFFSFSFVPSRIFIFYNRTLQHIMSFIMIVRQPLLSPVKPHFAYLVIKMTGESLNLALLFHLIESFNRTALLPFKPFLHLSTWWIPIYHLWSLRSLSLSPTFLSASSRAIYTLLFDPVILWHIFLIKCLYYGIFHISLAVYKLSLHPTQSQKERTIVYWFLNSWSLAQNLTQSGCSIHICWINVLGQAS